MKHVLICGALCLAQSCASAQPEVAAVIDKPTAESRAELAQAVSRFLNGGPVTLADDALTHDSLLIIEKARTGRDLDKPEHFRLVKEANRCTLVHERTGQRATLAATACRPK